MKRCLIDSLMIVALVGAVALMIVLYGVTLALSGAEPTDADRLEW